MDENPDGEPTPEELLLAAYGVAPLTQEGLERALRDAKPGDVLDLQGHTVHITRPPVALPDGVTIKNGTFVL